MEGPGDPSHSERRKKDGVTRACSNFKAGEKSAPLRSEKWGGGEKEGERQSTSHGAQYFERNSDRPCWLKAMHSRGPRITSVKH